MFHHSVVIQDQAISADGIYTYDLGVNPLSVLLLALRPLNDTGTLTNYQGVQGIYGAVNRLKILYRGESVIDMSGADLGAMNWLRRGIVPSEANPATTNNDRRTVVLPVFLGKWAYSRESCFPATKRGELVLELDLDIADTGYDGLRISAEAVELLGASPKEYERCVQISQTNAATGDTDFELHVGNPSRGLLLWGTTAYTGATPAPSFGRTQLLLDNQQVGYASTDWEVFKTLPFLWGRHPQMQNHVHILGGTGAAGDPTALVTEIDGTFENHAFLDLDPSRDDAFTLDTAKAKRWQLRTNVGTADAVRVVPIEVIRLK